MHALRVTYRTPLDGELRAWMTQQLIKYLLFMRGQIPCLYDEFHEFVENAKQHQQEEAPRRRKLSMNGGMKRAVKCVEAVQSLFGGQLDAIFTLGVQRVALVFGSSMMTPREVVIVDFDIEKEISRPPAAAVESPQTEEEDMSIEDSQTLSPPSPPMAREKLMRLCSQKLIRALFAHTMEQFSSALPATQLHIAVLAERQATTIRGFIPKQQFKLRLPKEKRGGTLRFSKQLQERDEFIRAAKSGSKEHRERMQQVIKDEFTKPLPVTAQFYQELTAQQRENELKTQAAAERHMKQLQTIQTKLDAREVQMTRRKEFERKKKELFADA
ncbi:hypothetical protein BBJ29_004127 [Phytophthora kernoviae]|uniref:Uncharacterized protein n=1 Tax=Phytophthora kernoviae TaxID=325452 RepID=A0A3F2RNF8_9STRA|nr:hypothetical protein BBJ29_004127 [Phytophthora kernoviae]RLN61128.1 hypothetical protein BBP00_00005600 [Phytophthora kernoviae]